MRGLMPRYIKEQLLEGWVPVCPENKQCRFHRAKRSIHVLNSPEVLVLNLAWQRKARAVQICKVFASLKNKMRAGEISGEGREEYCLKGLVGYDGCHYISYVYEGRWHKCDDSIVREIDSMREVVADAIIANMWPVAVIYDKVPQEYVEITVDEWVMIEKNAILYDIEAEFHQITSFWVCDCGKQNEDYDFYCSGCLKNRFSDYRWACDHCSSFNNENSVICTVCNTSRLRPTYSSLHQKLKSQDFYFTTPKKSGSTVLDRKLTDNFVRLSKTQQFEEKKTLNVSAPINEIKPAEIEPKPTVSTVIFPYSGVNYTQSSYFRSGEAQDIKKYMSQSLQSEVCKKCNSKCKANKNLCINCEKSYIFCSDCAGVFKKNGQICSCNLRKSDNK